MCMNLRTKDEIHAYKFLVHAYSENKIYLSTIFIHSYREAFNKLINKSTTN